MQLSLKITVVVDAFKGVRVGMLIGGAGTAFGTILKVFSVRTDGFWLVLLCQGIVAATQTLILGLPPKLAAIWFGPNQVDYFLVLVTLMFAVCTILFHLGVQSMRFGNLWIAIRCCFRLYTSTSLCQKL